MSDKGMTNDPRYMGIPTFMRTAYVPDPQGLDIAMLGIPYDGGVTNRPGARHGPREMRNQSSLMRVIHHVTRRNPYDLCKIADVGDVPFRALFDEAQVRADIESSISRIQAAGALPLAAGGDHSVTYPILKVLGAKQPVGLIHIDAHTDTGDEFQGSKFHHGAPFRRAVEAGVLDPSRTIQIGIRGAHNTPEGWDFSLSHGMRVIFMEEFTSLGVTGVIEEALRVVGSQPTYISFDVDGLDPVYAPGTGTPEIGGITTVEALALLRGLKDLNLVGADVVEVAPPFDPSGNTALVGATLMFELLCLLAESHYAKRA